LLIDGVSIGIDKNLLIDGVSIGIDKNLLIDGVSIGKLKLCVKRKPQQDVGLYLIRHFRED